MISSSFFIWYKYQTPVYNFINDRFSDKQTFCAVPFFRISDIGKNFLIAKDAWPDGSWKLPVPVWILFFDTCDSQEEQTDKISYHDPGQARIAWYLQNSVHWDYLPNLDTMVSSTHRKTGCAFNGSGISFKAVWAVGAEKVSK